MRLYEGAFYPKHEKQHMMQIEWLKSKNPKSKVSASSPEHLFKHIKRDSWLAGLPGHLEPLMAKDIPSIIAVGGGKGGVGKSVLSANLAAKIAQSGLKVLLIDLDIGGANLHTYFGLSLPEKTLANLVIHNQAMFEELIIQTPISGVALIPGGKDESWSDVSHYGSESFSDLWEGLFHSKELFGFDIVLIDLGAGINRHTIDFFCAAHLGMMTVLPEPTSIENAYSFLRATLWRLIENTGLHCGENASIEPIKEVLFGVNGNQNLRNNSYLSKLRSLESQYPDMISHIMDALTGRLIGFVVNQIRSQKDIDVAQSMSAISHNFFGFMTTPLGYLNYDDAAWKALRNRRLLVSDFPHSILSRRLSEINLKVLNCLGYQ